MPRRIPKLVHHKPSGQARVRIKGRDHYLGKWGSDEAQSKYERLVADLLVDQMAAKPVLSTVTIDQLCLAYFSHCTLHYRKDGKQTGEATNIRAALRPLVKLFGPECAITFGPKKLKAVRDEMIRLGWCRTSINKQVSRVRSMFRWAASEELLPSSVYNDLATLPGLKRGRSKAVERQPVKPVPMAFVDAVEPFVSRSVWGMIQTQLLTGMRPGEVRIMRGRDLNTSGDIWEYAPESHKTEHHGHERFVMVGPKAQAVLSDYLTTNLGAYVFPSKPGRCYSKVSYAKAIEKACEAAFGMPKHLRRVSTKLPAKEREQLKAEAREWRQQNCWSPNRLRHNAGTEIRRQFGIDAAQTILGHASANITEVYAEKDRQKAADIMRKIG